MQGVIDRRVHDYYWLEELSCAVTTLKILSELYEQELHPQVMDAAFGLNAGRCGSQCGLVEGALLFIGIYGKHKELDSAQLKDRCREFCTAFQNRFGSLLCKELRPQGFDPQNPPHLCETLTKQAISFSVDFVGEKLNTHTDYFSNKSKVK